MLQSLHDSFPAFELVARSNRTQMYSRLVPSAYSLRLYPKVDDKKLELTSALRRCMQQPQARHEHLAAMVSNIPAAFSCWETSIALEITGPT